MKKYEKNAEKLKEILSAERNIILRGAPGTGKSYLSKDIAALLISNNCKYDGLNSEEKSRIGFVQFHPSYDYTDFVEGLKPVISNTGEMRFELRDGIFKSFVSRAKNDIANKYVFIIDEINRGEISKIFGELFFSIDPGYRGTRGKVLTQYSSMREPEYKLHTVYKNNDGNSIYTKYDEEIEIAANREFYIPENVYIIGTMNDIDRSVDTFDFAMRRRFSFIEITAADSAINMMLPDFVRNRMQRFNERLVHPEIGLTTDHQIGAAYFREIGKNGNTFEQLWDFKIEPLLKDYLRGETNVQGKINYLKQEFIKN